MKTTQKRGMRSADLYALKSVTDPQISPDGTRVIYVHTSINNKTNKYESHLYIYDFEQKTHSQWTNGGERNHSPRWSPDGNAIAFLSNREKETQIYLMATNGGESRKLTKSAAGVSSIEWCPFSKRILFSVSLKPGEQLVDKQDSEDKDDELEPVVVEGLRYKLNGVGFFKEKRKQLAFIDINTGMIEQLTSDKSDYQDAIWSPDGSSIAFSASMADDRDEKLTSDVFVMSLTDRQPKKLTNSNGMFDSLRWSPDGQYLAFKGHEKEFDSATLSKIWLYHLKDNYLRCLTDGLDVHFQDVAVTDSIFNSPSPEILWTEDSQGYYTIASDQGSTAIYYGSIHGELFPVRSENEHIYGLTINAKNHTGVLGISTPTKLNELYYHDFKTGESHPLTVVHEELLKKVQLSEPEILSFQSKDGLDLQGWLLKPIGYKDGEKIPLILEIHGGPHMMYANTYVHEFQTLAEKGFAVLYINPRGSHGYGQQFVNLVRGHYGEGDYQDVMNAVDYVCDHYSFIDKVRIGVTGGSYGGYMTNWIVGHTNRFKAAVTQRSISNWISFYGVSDIGYYFTEWEIGGDLISDHEKLWHHSPLKYVKNIETPLLILHGEKDHRCPIEQAEQLYTGIKRLKKEVSFIRFPEADHDLSRNGNPKQRVKRLDAIAEWFIKYV